MKVPSEDWKSQLKLPRLDVRVLASEDGKGGPQLKHPYLEALDRNWKS